MSGKLRNLLCFILLLPCFVGASAQPRKKAVLNYQQHDERLIHFGFCLGLNMMDYSITPSLSHYQSDSLLTNVSKLTPGFHIQAVGAMRLRDNLELRFLPGVAFGSRNLLYYYRNAVYDDKQKLESSYIELPLLLKYKSTRVDNYRAYVIGGINPRFDLAKTYREDDGIYLDLGLFDLCYELGGGFDFYFPFFKLSLEIRGSWGMFNILKQRSTPRPEYQNAVEKLHSSTYLFSIYIE